MLVPFILARFIDRDNDAFISAEDIYTAMICALQKTLPYLKVS